MPVKESDVLTIPEEAKWNPIPVLCRGKLNWYNKNYMPGEPEKTNFLFVSEEMIEHFKSRKIEKTETGYKLTVDEEYLFGQQEGDKNRFLVYHDKKRVVFQRSFVDGTLVAISKQATDISIKLGYGEVKMVSSIISGLGLDKLHPMSEASK